ncbi:ribosome biogenesis GTPase Der [Natroniella acetigena]|uniref:ribosome biogenesis GTPase Der n=1 Tax=Natroniella acetigena TaxID=52004 RepID=UPI00200B8B38|nr:ribosome biogenesis GTPase Der [Natroniella acetigena]MCK8827598.1 ribosome biogenesis GTPase Der [Natroniella acetigena]
MNKPVVAIVGRPNVGKSTLFNRIVGNRVSIVEDKPSITRDRLYSDTEWLGRPFLLVDTGGIELDADTELKDKMRYQAQMAIDEADVILFVVDIREGLTVRDREVADFLRQSNKEIIVVANKAENHEQAEMDKYDFYELGFGEIYLISAQHGLGTGDLLDQVISHFPEQEDDDYAQDAIKISIIGRPNVGKSSLVNKILGQDRVIVSDIAGTTRDAIDTYFEHEDKEYVVIDTAGIRRKGKVNLGVERYSVIRSLKAIDRSDIALMVIDATEGMTEQDKKVAGYAHEGGKGVVLVVNKWDLIEKDGRTMNRYLEEIRYEAKFLNYAPVTFISALTGKRVLEVLEIANYVAEQHARRVDTSVLNSVIEEATLMFEPPANKQGKRLKIYYGTQPRVKPPTFVMFVNDPELINFSYRRYLKNQLRKAFGFEGTPIKIIVRERS